MGLMFHVDESADKTHHFHGGILIDACDAASASKQLDEIVDDSFDAGLCRWEAELHATDILNGSHGWKGPLGDRIDVMHQALEVLAHNNIEVIAHGAHIPSVRSRYGGAFDPYRWEFSNLLERLNERLRARDEYAVVIADDNAVHRNRLQRLVIDSREVGTGGYRHQKLTRIVDTAHFVDSKLSRMTQLADLVVYVLRRRSTIPTERDSRAEAASARLFRLAHHAIPHPRVQYRTVRS